MQIGGLLVGLAAKGTTVEELVGASTVMREMVIPIDCGWNRRRARHLRHRRRHPANLQHLHRRRTHRRRSWNQSRQARQPLASGHSGAADALEKLGLKLQIPPANLRRRLDRANICFAFAQAHHPAMKHVADARKALGIPTIFNLLGPLTNPGRARHQLLGVFAPELTDRLAAVLRDLGSRRAWVVHAEDGLDEISTLGPTRISELRDGHIQTWTLDPKDFQISYARLSDLQISTVDEAADALTSVLNREPGPKRDIALLNAAAAMVVAEAAKDLNEGLELARKSLDEGNAAKALELLIAESKAG